jgi:hypothetical protein
MHLKQEVALAEASGTWRQAQPDLRIRDNPAKAIMEAAEALLHRHLIRTLCVLAAAPKHLAAILERLRRHVVFGGHLIKDCESNLHLIAA